jgi:hypothetical protein
LEWTCVHHQTTIARRQNHTINPTQLPFVDPVTGLAEIFVMAGDPTKGTGWIDGMVLPPGDRRLVMNTGPFQMTLGDTQDVVIGLIGGMG